MQPDGTGGVTRPPLARGESASAQRETPAAQRCPRCAALIEGEYRFCPSCAYRLRPGSDPEPESSATPPWKRGFVVAAGVALLLGALLVGILVFHPSWLGAGGAGGPSTPAESASYAEPAFTVADIPGSIVELPPWGHVTEYRVASLTKEADKVKLEALLLHNPDLESLPVRIWWALPIMKYEVTQGQYEEFLRDVEEHPERVPDMWVRVQKGAKRPQDVSLWSHVPEAWITRDKDGEPVSWRVDPLQRNLPVTSVSYFDAWGFAEWASQKLGIALALPIEMEWTRAARAGRLTVPRPDPDPDPQASTEFWRWPWGSEPLIYACNNSQFWPGKGRPEYVHLVYSEPRGGGGGTTPDGLFGMAGNVGEWALENDVELVADPKFGADAYIAPVFLRGDTADAYAMGGSFRDGIDDCQVDSKRKLHKVEKNFEKPEDDDRFTRRDDLGFRLVLRR